MSKGTVVKVSGPLVVAEGMRDADMFDVVRVGEERLIGEIIEMHGDRASIQVYEETAGLGPGVPVISTGAPLSVELAPGMIEHMYDGIQRPLERMVEVSGSNIRRGIDLPAVDHEKKWHLVPQKAAGDAVIFGDVLGTVQETDVVVHKIMVPQGADGEIISITEGDYTVDEPFCKIKGKDGKVRELPMLQRWPVRKGRPYKSKLPLDEPLITGQRVMDTFFPIARGGVAAIPGPFGSGKTVVFLKLIERTLELGRRALVLVPEISLTPQMIRRLKSTFGSRLAVQHSALNNTERLLQWRMIQQGNADIVVGTRSAVFSPLQNLGLIIVDEEQEHTYQSESAPRYDAHDIAKKRAVMENALLVFVYAKPLNETYHAAQSGKLKLVTLTQRYGGCPLPSVDFIDMRAELTAGNSREVSRRLARELQENLDNGEQSILLLNRRGYRTIGMCTDCGHVLKCPNCSVPLVYHKPQQALMCHHCGQTVHPLPTLCPECGGKIHYSGFGTQRVEEELAELLPSARILRMDQDSTGKKNAHETMLAQFARHEYDILLGTQMVAKGLDFEKVTLVGVLGIDSLLFGQGFRAYESVFSLVTQVIGRGGRDGKFAAQRVVEQLRGLNGALGTGVILRKLLDLLFGILLLVHGAS